MAGVMAGWLGIGLRAQTEQLDAGLKRGRDSVKGFSSDVVKAGRQGLEPFRGALSAVGGEIASVAGGAVGLASNLGKAFLVGGPVLAGVTALGLGISKLVGGMTEASEKADKAREAFLRWTSEAGKKVDELRESIADVDERTGTISAGGDVDAVKRAQSLRNELEKIRREGGQEVAKLAEGVKDKAELDALVRAANARTSERIRLLEEKAAAETREAAAAADAANEKAAAKEVEALQREVRELKTKTDLEREILRIRERARALLDLPGLGVGGVEAVSQWRKAAEGAARERADAQVDKRAEGSLGKVRGFAKDLNKGAEDFAAKQKKQRDSEWEDLRRTAEKTNVEIAKRQDALVKQKQEHGDFVRSLQDEVELLRAGNGAARDRLLIQRELKDNLEQAKGDEQAIAAAKALANERLAELARDEAESAKRKADEEARATKEKREQAELARKQDITKRFAALPGTGGTFGFGAGTAGFGWMDGGGDMGRRQGKTSAPGAPGKTAPTVNLPDLTPEFKALEAELAKIPPWVEQLTKAVTGFSGATKQSVREVGEATVRAVGELRRDERELEAEVRSLKRALERAGSLGVD